MNAPRDLFITGVVMMLCLVGGEAAISAPRTNSSRAPAGQQVGPGAMPKFEVDATCRAAVDVPTATPATCLRMNAARVMSSPKGGRNIRHRSGHDARHCPASAIRGTLNC